MAQGVYIAATEPRSGKSVVTLGMMEALSRHGRKVGFFRPVIRAGEQQDRAIELIAGQYNLELPYEAMYGCTHDTARELITSGRQDDLFTRIMGKYQALQAACDLVLCVGPDYTGVTAALEFDFGVELVNNLGCLILPLVNGRGRSSRDVGDVVRVLLESLEEKRCEVFATAVNRVAPGQLEAVRVELRRAVTGPAPAFALPEHPLLEKPTMGEVARALNARILSGGEEGLDREIRAYKVAAMELPHFLGHLEDGSLVITPGDRSDIILGTLLSDVSATYPQVAGLLLTGDLAVAEPVQRLVQGLTSSPVPVLSVKTDTFETALTVSSIEGAIVPQNQRKVAAALGIVEANVDFQELERRISAAHSTRVTPLMFECELIRRAKASKQHIVLPEGTDERILRAAEILRLRDVVDLTLLGDPDEVRPKISALGLSMEEVPVVDPAQSGLREKYAHAYYELRKHKGISEQMAHDAVADVSYFGTMMVHFGDAGGMVSGAAHTTQHTIRPALEIIRTKAGCSIVSSVFFMCLADRVLVYGDCAVNPKPTAKQLADIAISSAETAQMFGIEPRIAMLSYSTGESGKGEDVDRVREATQIAREQRPGLKLEGPIQYDAAVDASVARSKLPGSEVAGHATVFIFPDLNTGNNTYKAVQRSAGAVAIGPILQGLNKPVNDLSRGCLVADVVNTVAITAIQAGVVGIIN